MKFVVKKMVMDEIKSQSRFFSGETLPLLALRNTVVFPHMVLPLSVGREKSLRALEKAMGTNRYIFVVAQRQPRIENPGQDDLYQIGCISQILQILKMPDETAKVMIEGISRARIREINFDKEYLEVRVQRIVGKAGGGVEMEAIMRHVASLFEEYVKLNPHIPLETGVFINNISSPERLADVIAANLTGKVKEKQEILETIDPKERLLRLSHLLSSENEVLTVEHKIQSRVRQQIGKSQKEYYLQEQLKAIQKELKGKSDTERETEELREQIKKAHLSKEAQEAAEKELSRLAKMMPYSPESTVIRTYLDWIINLPWAVRTEDKLDLKKAEQQLKQDHYGLEKAKERVLEYLAVRQLAPDKKGPILCFVGPPGTGKTSLGRSIANTLGRKFVRVSLGGIRDEAEVRGHRRTYIGALPGRIIQGIRKAKSRNPVFLLDEIDKVGTDFRGDPTAALLEVLDPEQNNSFSDHYLEVGFDLSEVMFITTANTLYTIPPTLQDRLETISFPGYTTEEKIKIAEKFLVPKQFKENGLDKENLFLSSQTIKKIILNYTSEAGVRNLEREIAKICRKVARKLVETKKELVKVTAKNLSGYLGPIKFRPDWKEENEVGVATGLAWTEAGGTILPVEVSVMRGKGALTLTGKLGEVMKESGQAALSYVRANAKKWGLKEDFYKGQEVHIHVPEGAVPKDGPSAGISIITALLSALTNRPVKRNVALTGEITLRGHVLPIGGFKEKILAAHRAGIKTIIFPQENKKNLVEIPANIQHQIEFIPVKNVEEAFKQALV